MNPHVAPPSRSSRSRLSVVLAAAAAVAGAALLPGCCESHDEDVCALLDYSEGSCPSTSEFAKMTGMDAKSGPEEKTYVDLRSTASQNDYGAYGRLCCYRVHFESCSEPNLAGAY